MLSRVICDKCWIKHLPESSGNIASNCKRGWWCPPDTEGRKRVSDEESPPKGCPYKLEQAMFEGMRNGTKAK